MGYAKSIVLTGLVLGLAGLEVVVLPAIAETTVESTDPRKISADQSLQKGLKHYESHEYEAAIQVLTQALERYREIKDRKDEAYVLSQLGIAYYSLGNYTKSIEFHQQRLAIDTELNDRSSLANTLQNIGLAHQAQRNFPRAIIVFEKSLALRHELKDHAKEAVLLEKLGGLAYEQQDYSSAIGYFEQNLLIAREVKNLDSEFVTLKNLGVSYAKLKKSDRNSEKALEYSTLALKLAEKMGDQRRVANALRDLGILHMTYNRFKPPLENFQKSLEAWHAINDQAMEANLLSLLGGLYATRVGSDGEIFCPIAINYYERSLPILRQLKNQSLEAEVLTSLGYCYEETHDHQKAIDYLILSLEISRQTKQKRQEGFSLVNLGKSYRSIGNLPQARQYAEQGRAIFRELQDHTQEVIALESLANIYAASAEHRQAIEAQSQKIIIAQKYNVRLTEGGFNAVSVNIEQAKKFDYLKWQKRKYKWSQRTLEQRGFSVNRLNLSEANISDFLFYIRSSFMSLGDAYYQSKDYSRALEFYQAALDPDYDKGYSFGFIDIELLGKLGQTFSKMDRLSEAESMLQLALKYGEEFRTGLGYSTTQNFSTDATRILLADRKVKNFQQLQQVLVRQNRMNDALEISEEARSRTFVELLSARISGRPLGKDLPPSPKLEEIRSIAKTQNATLVQYSIINPEQLYIWVIKPSGEVIFKISKLPATISIDQLVADSRSSIAVVYPDKPKPAPKLQSELDLTLQKLHKTLIEPIESDLPKDPNQRVIFLPQGELFLVPFAALKDASGKYFIEKHTISTAPSIQTLQLTREKAKLANTNGTILVIGDPTMPIFEGTQLPNLPGARQEAIDIAKLFNIEPLIGNQATKATVLNQMKTASIVHLATHGLLNTIKGDVPGAIALAPSGQDNGLLTASEIFDLKLTADLVVLSACDTGRGDIKGDGVIGLSRSLIAAGVPSVVVSLWAVSDNSTSVLMSDFYRNLKTNPNKAQSMRQAMLNTMKQYPSPRDWAAFTLVGESDRP